VTLQWWHSRTAARLTLLAFVVLAACIISHAWRYRRSEELYLSPPGGMAWRVTVDFRSPLELTPFYSNEVLSQDLTGPPRDLRRVFILDAIRAVCLAGTLWFLMRFAWSRIVTSPRIERSLAWGPLIACVSALAEIAILIILTAVPHPWPDWVVRAASLFTLLKVLLYSACVLAITIGLCALLVRQMRYQPGRAA